jgi:hypothetical protein
MVAAAATPLWRNLAVVVAVVVVVVVVVFRKVPMINDDDTTTKYYDTIVSGFAVLFRRHRKRGPSSARSSNVERTSEWSLCTWSTMVHC